MKTGLNRKIHLTIMVMIMSCINPDIEKVCEEDLNKEKGEYSYFTELENAISCSKKTNRPILIIFTSWGGIGNSRHTWDVYKDKKISNLISRKFIELVLYIDETTPLKESYTSCFFNNEREIRTVGAKNSDFQRKEFNSVSCPYYGIVDSKKNQLVKPIGYEKKREFEKFLRVGLAEFKNRKH